MTGATLPIDRNRGYRRLVRGWQTAHVDRSIVAPNVPADDRLHTFDLEREQLRDEIELEDVLVTGAAPGVAARNLELSSAWLRDVDLAGARLPRLDLRNCRVSGSNLANVAIHHGAAERCAFQDVRLTGCSWHAGILRDVSFRGCRIDLASFAASRLERVLFEGCSLAGSELQDARLSAVVFVGCDMREIDLAGLRLSAGCELRGCVLDGARNVAQLRGAQMPYVDVLAAAGTFAHALGIAISSDEEAS
jgi:uncharacterized protein YjbI with pentapeptide repeats